MNTHIQRQWAEAVRSGRYEHATSVLRWHNGFCVLGILCDIHAIEHGNAWIDVNGFYWSYLGAINCLPHEVATWAGLPNNNPDVLIWDSHEKRNVRTSLASVSDSLPGAEALAKLIEDNIFSDGTSSEKAPAVSAQAEG